MARKYDEQFKDGACRLVMNQAISIREASRRVNVPDMTLSRWLAARGWTAPMPVSASGRTPAGDSDDPLVLKARIRQLEADLRKSESANEFLKKATAYFASQNP